MIRYIVKRSGDKVSFDARKIKSAIFKANTRIAAERMSDADLNELTEEVLTALEKLPGTPTAQYFPSLRVFLSVYWVYWRRDSVRNPV